MLIIIISAEVNLEELMPENGVNFGVTNEGIQNITNGREGAVRRSIKSVVK